MEHPAPFVQRRSFVLSAPEARSFEATQLRSREAARVRGFFGSIWVSGGSVGLGGLSGLCG